MGLTVLHGGGGVGLTVLHGVIILSIITKWFTYSFHVLASLKSILWFKFTSGCNQERHLRHQSNFS